MTLFNVFPTTLEISLVTGIVATKFGSYHALACLATVGAYVLFTVKYSASRIPIRKRMNAADAAVGGHAIDTLVNYESVKYFGNEEHEARKYDELLGEYQARSRRPVVLWCLHFVDMTRLQE
jgi:ABC-type transport system involved in Fe-S cluster assembly fused permease/ATPase subunit